MAELKPCPFCGGSARISADPEATKDTQGRLWAFTVVCDKCCATSGLTFSTERAIEAWNRRAGEAAPVVHSEWEITDVEHAYGTKCYHCPECGEDEWRYDAPNYCPNCGVKMDSSKRL